MKIRNTSQTVGDNLQHPRRFSNSHNHLTAFTNSSTFLFLFTGTAIHFEKYTPQQAHMNKLRHARVINRHAHAQNTLLSFFSHANMITKWRPHTDHPAQIMIDIIITHTWRLTLTCVNMCLFFWKLNTGKLFFFVAHKTGNAIKQSAI